MKNFNSALNNTVKQRYGAEKSVFSQKSKIMSLRASQKMPPSVFGRPTFRDHPGAKDIFGTYDGRKATQTIDNSKENPLNALVDEVLQESGNAHLYTIDAAAD